MASDVKVRFRSFLPGGGFDSAGNPRQGKTRVVGEVDVTSYGGDGGERLTAADLGLTTIDAITLRVREEIGGNARSPQRMVAYAPGTGHFYLHTVAGNGDKTIVAAAGTENLEFVAEGDSAADVELV